MPAFAVHTVDAQPAAAMHAEVPMAELRGVFDRGFGEVMRVVASQGVAITGAPFGFYPRMPTDTVEVVVGFPVSAAVSPDGDVSPFELPGGAVVEGVHIGDYESLTDSYEQLTAWAAAEGLKLAPCMWESYLSDPRSQPDPATWQTKLSWPLATT